LRHTANILAAGSFAVLTVTGHASQQDPQRPAFRVSVNLVTTDVIVRDSKTGQFISDLKPEELEVYEDGVKQEIVLFVLSHGGRVFNVQAPPAAPVREGIVLPASRSTSDVAGRVFLLFIDDLHLDFRSSPRARSLIEKMLTNLIHEGDLRGIVSTGPSSISQDLTYDRQVLAAAVKRITGGGLRADEIIKGMHGAQGPAELLYRAHVAFSTAYDLDDESRGAEESPQGRAVRQQRLRLQSLRNVAPAVPGRALWDRCGPFRLRSVLEDAVAGQPVRGG
jgi:VWFA-related protein